MLKRSGYIFQLLLGSLQVTLVMLRTCFVTCPQQSVTAVTGELPNLPPSTSNVGDLSLMGSLPCLAITDLCCQLACDGARPFMAILFPWQHHKVSQ